MTADPLFVNTRLDDSVEQGAKGGPGFLTTVLPLASGMEKRNIEWSRQRQKWDIGYGIQTKEDFEAVLAHFYVCMGKAHGFRFKDWTDFQIGRDGLQKIGTGDNVATTFQATRLYSIAGGAYTYSRKITRLVQGTVKVYLNGALKTETTDYTVNYDTGLITFVVHPGMGVLVQLQAEFDTPVRFDTDMLDIAVTWSDAMAAPQIAIIELKE